MAANAVAEPRSDKVGLFVSRRSENFSVYSYLKPSKDIAIVAELLLDTLLAFGTDFAENVTSWKHRYGGIFKTLPEKRRARARLDSRLVIIYREDIHSH